MDPLVDVIEHRMELIECNLRMGHASGSDFHLKLSTEVAKAILRRFQRIDRFTSAQAMKLIGLFSTDVFPRDVYDQLIQEVNNKTDLDLDMADSADPVFSAKDVLASPQKQTCEFFYNYIPSKMWNELRKEGADT